MSEQFGNRPPRPEEPPRNTPPASLLASTGQDLAAIPRRTDSDFAPLSFVQQRLWFLEQLEPGLPINNIPLILRLSGPLDAAALQSALGAIVRRHESLRTCIQVRDGEPIQWITAEQRIPVLTVDLSSLTEKDREVEALRLAAIEIREPFDLTHAPMLRARLFQIAHEDHLLVVTMHHIAADGWSVGIFFRELGILYDAHSSGLPASLPDLPIQYADFAVWQRGSLQGELLDQQLSYWRERLHGAPALLDLPTDRPRPALQSYRGAVHRFVLPLSLLQQLKALSRREGATLFMTLLAAFQALLSRYTGQSDLLVGTPIAGRTELETESLIGCFINTLVFRTDLSADPTFRELLGQVLESALEAYSRQDLPFERLVEELRPARSLGHSPIFQVLFNLQNAPREEVDFAGLRATTIRLERVQSRFDLSLEVVEKPDGLSCSLVFNTDLFDAETVSQMTEHYGNLLRGIVSDPECRVSSLPLLSEAERRRLLIEWNDTEVDTQTEKDVRELFEEQARNRPESVAVEFGASGLTYEELNRRADQLAHHLRRLGVGSNQLVGVAVDRGPDMVTSLLAVLKAGAGYVPLDPSYPVERLAYMIRDAELSLILTTQQNGLPPLSDATPRIHLDADWPEIATAKPGNLPGRAAPESLAYVIYTSGSTGRPKGVEIPHRALTNLLRSMRRSPGLTGEDTFLAVTSLSFDIAALEIFLPLTVGARLVIASRGDAMDGRRLDELIRVTGATAMQATPSLWRTVLDAGWKGEPKLKMLCGGESLPKELSDSLRSKGASLWNLYGPTETTVWSTVARIESDDGPVVAGRPIENTRIYLLDRNREPVPIGVVGEVWIGGAGVARGYRNLPDLTETQFRTDPFRREPDARMYRTGDLGKHRRDGSLVILGRSDDQVKIRGFRIELGEIEAALLAHPEIRDAAAAAREDVPGDRTLVAYFVPAPTAAVSSSELRHFLQERLPEYMVPTALVSLDRLPRLPNGKVDRRSLPAPDRREAGSERTYVAPRTPVEETVARIWAQVLRLDRVGIEDNFFELGGHSLLATQMFSRLRRAFRVDLPIRTLFEMPTVAQLCASIEKARGRSGDVSSPPILPASRNPSSRQALASEPILVEESVSMSTVSNGTNPASGDALVSDTPGDRQPTGNEASGVGVAPLSSVERQRVLFEWNETREAFPTDPLPRVFEAQAKRTPDRVAVESGGRTLTYRELDARANGLARRLRELGVGPEVLVGVCVTRSAEMVVALLAVLKAGGAYVPMDPAFPKDRLGYILEDSTAAVLITERGLADALPAGTARPVFLEDTTAEFPTPPRVPISSDVLAYVMYTSGSTGRPKGVAVTHGSLINLLSAMRVRPGMGNDDVLLAVTTLSFDIAGLELFLPLVAGGRLVIASRETASNGTSLAEELQSCGVTMMQATPATWRMLLESGWRGQPQVKVLCGGEAMSRELARRLTSISDSVWNMYGPTETTIWSSCERVDGAAEGLVPIGRPIANTRMHVLDGNMEPTPLGVPGELFIGGAGVARGYWKRPELTAQKFVADPFEIGERLYRTGDMARYLPDGRIEFWGRLDDQVKIRGYRIELGEVETVLSGHPAIRECVAAAFPDGSEEKRLVAYVVARSQMPTAAELRAFARKTLPEYMVPAMFIPLDHLPMTPNAKVDRRALPSPGTDRPQLDKPFVAPRDALEQELARIWERVFQLGSVGVQDDFFELGGHSLLAGRIFAEIEKSRGRSLPPTTLLQAPTIEKLGLLLGSERAPSGWRSLVPIQTGGSRTPLFCMHAGAGTILFYQDLAHALGPDQPVYGLQARGLYGDQSPHCEVAEMAAHYASEIRTVQPTGPYYLTGFCFGGLLAFAVASELRRTGGEVALLSSFEGGSPPFGYAHKNHEAGAAQWLGRHGKALQKLSLREKLSYLARKGKTRLRLWGDILRERMQAPISAVIRGMRWPLPEVLRRAYFRPMTLRATKRYAPPPYPGRMVLFETKGLFRDTHLGWDGYLRDGVEVHEISVCDTGRYHADFIRAVSEPFQRVLAEASERSASAARSVAAGAHSQDGTR